MAGSAAEEQLCAAARGGVSLTSMFAPKTPPATPCATAGWPETVSWRQAAARRPRLMECALSPALPSNVFPATAFAYSWHMHGRECAVHSAQSAIYLADTRRWRCAISQGSIQWWVQMERVWWVRIERACCTTATRSWKAAKNGPDISAPAAKWKSGRVPAPAMR